MEMDKPQKLSSLQLAAKKSGVKVPKRKSTQTHCVIENAESHGPLPTSAPNSGRSMPTMATTYSPYASQPSHHFEIGSSAATPSEQLYQEINMECEHHPVHVSQEMDLELEHHSHFHHNSTSVQQSPAVVSSTSTLPSFSVGQMSYTIGEDTNTPPPEKMTGVEDHGHKPPLVVLDGANIAHAYTHAVQDLFASKTGSTEPDATGILVAAEFFQEAGVRVLVVLPQYWLRTKPGANRTPQPMEQLEVLNKLQKDRLIVSAPPTDDDDAYALTIARREESRSLRRNGVGPGFVVSNDMFRDAQARDTTGTLRKWLNEGRNADTGPGRISYSFADMGAINDHGERILDFVGNPRHPLVVWMEGVHLSGHQ